MARVAIAACRTTVSARLDVTGLAALRDPRAALRVRRMAFDATPAAGVRRFDRRVAARASRRRRTAPRVRIVTARAVGVRRYRRRREHLLAGMTPDAAARRRAPLRVVRLVATGASGMRRHDGHVAMAVLAWMDRGLHVLVVVVAIDAAIVPALERRGLRDPRLRSGTVDVTLGATSRGVARSRVGRVTVGACASVRRVLLRVAGLARWWLASGVRCVAVDAALGVIADRAMWTLRLGVTGLAVARDIRGPGRPQEVVARRARGDVRRGTVHRGRVLVVARGAVLAGRWLELVSSHVVTGDAVHPRRGREVDPVELGDTHVVAARETDAPRSLEQPGAPRLAGAAVSDEETDGTRDAGDREDREYADELAAEQNASKGLVRRWCIARTTRQRRKPCKPCRAMRSGARRFAARARSSADDARQNTRAYAGSATLCT